MNKPRATSDHGPLVRCLSEIEARHHAAGWKTNGDFNAVYTLHRHRGEGLRALPFPLEPAARSMPVREVVEALTVAFHHPSAGAVLTAAPKGIVGLAVCSEAWMVARDAVGEPGMQLAEQLGSEGLLRLHPGRQEIRFAQGRLVDGTESLLHRTRGTPCELMKASLGGLLPDAVAALLAAMLMHS
jgi:hypothetical protein